MKKTMTHVFALVLACVLALSLTACGGSNSKAPAENSSKAVAANSKAPVESSKAPAESSAAAPESSKAPAGKFASIEEFVNSDEIQDQLKPLQDSLGDLMKIDVKGEDNKLIYEFTYTTDMGDKDVVVASLEQSMDAQAAVYENVAATLKMAVEVKDPIVEVRYLDKDGKTLYSREFTAK